MMPFSGGGGGVWSLFLVMGLGWVGWLVVVVVVGLVGWLAVGSAGAARLMRGWTHTKRQAVDLATRKSAGREGKGTWLGTAPWAMKNDGIIMVLSPSASTLDGGERQVFPRREQATVRDVMSVHCTTIVERYRAVEQPGTHHSSSAVQLAR